RQQRERQARQILLLFLFIVLLQRGIDFIGVQRALALGFVADKRFDDIIERFRQDDMEGRS
ncbi:hypothetical protein ACH57_04725, partial [Salmonella enterica subsp. enterica serovar Typhimurium]